MYGQNKKHKKKLRIDTTGAELDSAEVKTFPLTLFCNGTVVSTESVCENLDFSIGKNKEKLKSPKPKIYQNVIFFPEWKVIWPALLHKHNICVTTYRKLETEKKDGFFPNLPIWIFNRSLVASVVFTPCFLFTFIYQYRYFSFNMLIKILLKGTDCSELTQLTHYNNLNSTAKERLYLFCIKEVFLLFYFHFFVMFPVSNA